jgi:transcriptional regulator with XRE-family HTH domain
MTIGAGIVVHDERIRRGWTLRRLAGRAGISAAHLHALEAGGIVSLEAYARVITALDLRPELDASDPRNRKSRRP